MKGEPADHISSSDAEENAAQAPNEETSNLVIRPSKKKHDKKAVITSIDRVEVRLIS